MKTALHVECVGAPLPLCYRMKAHRLNDSKVVALFRPEMNIFRLYNSCERIGLPTFEKDSFLHLLLKLVQIESPFVPDGDGYSLYIRPVIFGTTEALGNNYSLL